MSRKPRENPPQGLEAIPPGERAAKGIAINLPPEQEAQARKLPEASDV